jgi:glucose/arabinose dehydrogenase
LQLVAKDLTHPLTMAEVPDGTGRMLIVDQIGVLRVMTRDGILQPQPLLDVRSRMVTLMPEYDERGLLGLAFHPQFASNGRMFVYYTAPPRVAGYDNTSTVAEFHLQPAALSSKPVFVGNVLQVDHPQFNHNGGTLAFGPDGMLYISIGDGGGRDDEGEGPARNTPVFGHVPDWYGANPGGNGQDIEANLLGNILRIDVGSPGSYRIPKDNPFIGVGLGEIYAYGFRNPYRFSFDLAGTHDLILADAGQDMWEEIDFVQSGGNYGWNVKEGTHCFDANNPMSVPASCPSVDPTTGEPLRDPVIEMYNLANPLRGSQEGVATLIGGYVYRGSAVPKLAGQYVFAALSTDATMPAGALYMAPPRGPGVRWQVTKLPMGDSENLDHYVLGFSQDLRGEIYVMTSDTLGPTGSTGQIYRFAMTSSTSSTGDGSSSGGGGGFY